MSSPRWSTKGRRSLSRTRTRGRSRNAAWWTYAPHQTANGQWESNSRTQPQTSGEFAFRRPPLNDHRPLEIRFRVCRQQTRNYRTVRRAGVGPQPRSLIVPCEWAFLVGQASWCSSHSTQRCARPNGSLVAGNSQPFWSVLRTPRVHEAAGAASSRGFRRHFAEYASAAARQQRGQDHQRITEMDDAGPTPLDIPPTG